MRCKNCNKSQLSGVNKYRCWVEDQLCGKCAINIFPEKYAEHKNLNQKTYDKREPKQITGDMLTL